jgi:hypothetical protein
VVHLVTGLVIGSGSGSGVPGPSSHAATRVTLDDGIRAGLAVGEQEEVVVELIHLQRGGLMVQRMQGEGLAAHYLP